MLGGAGMVGLAVARRIVRDLATEKVVIAALTDAEVDDALERLGADCRDGWSGHRAG